MPRTKSNPSQQRAKAASAERRRAASDAPRKTAPQETVSEDIDPRWLLKAGALIVLASLICGYLTLCLLFYQGQWQLILHPSRTSSTQPPVVGAESVHFAPGDSGTPELTGWWIPAAPGGQHAQATPSHAQAVQSQGQMSARTILLLRSGDGSLADNSALLNALHGLGLNVFAFDYRGYGASAATHPNQARMIQDADSAWEYLRTIHNLSAQQIIPYGIGVGAALATHLATANPQIPGLILQTPIPDIQSIVQNDSRTQLIPLRLLFNDRFPITIPLSTLHTPKLLMLGESVPSQESGSHTNPVPTGPRPLVATPKSLKSLSDSAASPKTISTLPSADFYGPIYLEQLTRFLDQYPSRH